MESKFNKFRKLMSDDQSSLPPELDWEQMQAGILEKMERLEAETSQEQPKEKRNRAMLLLLLLLVLLIPVLCTPRVAKDIKASSQPQAEETIIEPQLPIQELVEAQTSDNIQKEKESSLEAKTNPSTTLKETENRAKLTQFQPISIQEDQVLGELRNTLAKEQIVKLPRKNFLVQGETKKEVLPKPIEVLQAPKQDSKSVDKGRLAVEAGASLWSMAYGAEKPERQAYESTISSYAGQINYLLPLKNNFILSIGLQYQRLESRFDYNTTIEDYTIILEDTIIEVRNNLLTGSSTPIRGDVELMVPAERIIRHYNSISLYQLPLAIGKTWSSKKWQQDLLIGASLNLYTNNRGRTVYQGNIVDYDGPTTDFLNNQWAVNANVSGRLTYWLNDHLGLSTSVNLQRSLSNWSKEEKIKMFPSIVSWQLGASYNF